MGAGSPKACTYLHNRGGFSSMLLGTVAATNGEVASHVLLFPYEYSQAQVHSIRLGDPHSGDRDPELEPSSIRRILWICH